MSLIVSDNKNEIHNLNLNNTCMVHFCYARSWSKSVKSMSKLQMTLWLQRLYNVDTLKLSQTQIYLKIIKMAKQ